MHHWIFCADRTNGETAKVWIYDIEDDPKVYRMFTKGTEYVTDKVRGIFVYLKDTVDIVNL